MSWERQWEGRWGEDISLNRDGPPYGPRNAWSSLAYPAVGAVLPWLRPGAESWVMAAELTLLGVGSFAWHYWKGRFLNRLDHAGMFATFSGLTVSALVPGHALTALLMGVAGATAGFVFAYVLSRVPLNAQMGVFLALSILPPSLGYGDPRLAFVSLFLFLTAFACWVLDRRPAGWDPRVGPAPRLGPWGHAAWHALTAPAIVTSYLAQAAGR